MKNWLVLIISLPTENATARMRAWRTLKASGAGVLRDGVYLLPDVNNCSSVFESVTVDVIANGGNAYILKSQEPENVSFQDQFNRNDAYITLLDEIQKVRKELSDGTITASMKQIRKLRKNFAAIADTDFFPGTPQKQVDTALVELEVAVNRLLSPNEPHPVKGAIQTYALADYQGRIWATRKRPWVDRLASAWVIRRFIDHDARFLWLEQPSACPSYALGFDFDEAAFTHVGDMVTYEVLLTSFGLEQPALKRIGALVHYLDIGGMQPPEAAGVESVLAGLRDTIPDDDQLLALASSVFDGLLVTYGKAGSK